MIESNRKIELRGVRVHNLKNLDLDLPHCRLIVFSGVSGSGKSSLAFDTLYAEGQRRYIETFSPYVRQFLSKLDKPEADRIDGIPPAIAISQKMSRRSARSTVGTVTEIHDHLALLFGRVGRVICLDCKTEVRPADPAQVIAAIGSLPAGTRYQVAFPVPVSTAAEFPDIAAGLREEGFLRVRLGGQVLMLDDQSLQPPAGGEFEVIVDRLARGNEDPGRLADSIETAFERGQGECRLITGEDVKLFHAGWKCGNCGRAYLQPSPQLFRYSSPLGACPTCEGFGRTIDLDLDKIVPDPSKSLAEGAIAAWTTPGYRDWRQDLLNKAPAAGLPIDRPFKLLSDQEVRWVVEGDDSFPGLRGFFKNLERKAYKMHVRVFLSRWRSYRPCPTCDGARLRPEALAVELGGVNIAALASCRVSEAREHLDQLAVDDQSPVARRVLEQVRHRLQLLGQIGLDYLSLDRLARTLSGGEARRVAITTALGSGLVNTLYVLDEPSIGLHAQDVSRLLDCLKRLRDSGNSVIVVEHDPAVMRAADLLVDIGPGAGEAGGRLLYSGVPDQITECEGSVTGDFLAGRRKISFPRTRRPREQGSIEIRGARGNNLKKIDVAFPLGVFCVVAGVSGSGKSTLIEDTLYPALLKRLKSEGPSPAPYRDIRGANALEDVVLVDQSPIGRTARSNPVTYVRAFDEIRKTFAATHDAKIRNFNPSKFSFNVEGGRCSACEGNGVQVIDMQFLPDVMVRCPECQGTRYRPEVLQVAYRGKNIAQVLDLTVREAFAFFRHRPKVQTRLRPLMEVGLDYVRLGQPATTLSGGEAQRLKLAAYLDSSSAKGVAEAGESTLFLLDEPTTGLHPADIQTLMEALQRLVDLGHSLVIVEHSAEVIASADWVIELGPEAGEGGGQVIAQGTPEEIARADTPTAHVLRQILDKS